MNYRYKDLPKKCICEKCGYILENPGRHCSEIKCPRCGERMWRYKGLDVKNTLNKVNEGLGTAAKVIGSLMGITGAVMTIIGVYEYLKAKRGEKSE